MANSQDTTLTPISHNVISDWSRLLDGTITEDRDLGYLVSGYARRVVYVPAGGDQPVYVLALGRQCGLDAYQTDLWWFAKDFDRDEAEAFLVAEREARDHAALVTRRDRAEASLQRAYLERNGEDIARLEDVLADLEAELSCAWPRVESEPVDFAALMSGEA